MRKLHFKKRRSLKKFAVLTKKKFLNLVKRLTRKNRHKKHKKNRKQNGG